MATKSYLQILAEVIEESRHTCKAGKCRGGVHYGGGTHSDTPQFEEAAKAEAQKRFDAQGA